MNFRNKNILPFSATFLFISILSGCVKENKATFTDFSKIQDMVILESAGESNFKSANISVNTNSTDTLHLDVLVDLASAYPAKQDITVTLGIDDNQRTAYNTKNSTNYVAFTNSMYKLMSNKLTISASQHFAKTTVDIYQNKFDPQLSYILPIVITDASGKLLSGNQNTIYFNIIGNKMAGTYTYNGTRKNYTGSSASGTPSVSNLTGTKLAAPVSSSIIAIDYANLGGSSWQYQITFNSDYTAITDVSPNKTMADGIQAGSFTITAPWSYDPSTKTITVHTSYINTSGNIRLVDETFVKQ
jgi:hypothetical protein